MVTVEQVAAEFGARPERPGRTPWGALDQCVYESRRFVSALRAAGIEAETVSGVKMGQYEGFGDVVLCGHTVVRVGDVIYDWTARQFFHGPLSEAETAVPFPLVQTYDEWRAEWVSLSDHVAAKP